MSNQRHSKRATASLQKLGEEDPAFAALSLWCNHRDADIDQHARSTARTIYYGKSFTELGLAEQMGLAAHHILHIALRHAVRGAGLRTRLGKSFDSQLFNLGADAIVNDTLSAIGLIQPRPHATLSLLEIAEQSVSSWDVERLYFELAAQETDGSQGQSQLARQRAKELGFEEDLQISESGHEEEGTPGPTEIEWHQHLERALQAGRLAGRGLGMMGHRLADIPQTSTPWETLLRRLGVRALQEDQALSFRRPSARWIAMESKAQRTKSDVPPFQPSQQRTRYRPRIFVGLDSSGSVTSDQLSLFAAQVGAIARGANAELYLSVFDDTVRSTDAISSGNLAKAMGALTFSRDGGTDFRPVLAEAETLDPSLIVMLSDLEGPLPDRKPSCPVIWALANMPANPPPFGRVVIVDG